MTIIQQGSNIPFSLFSTPIFFPQLHLKQLTKCWDFLLPACIILFSYKYQIEKMCKTLFKSRTILQIIYHINRVIQGYLQGCKTDLILEDEKNQFLSLFLRQQFFVLTTGGRYRSAIFKLSGKERKTNFSFWSWRLQLAQVNFVFLTSLAMFSSRFWLCFACLCAPCNCCSGKKNKGIKKNDLRKRS